MTANLDFLQNRINYESSNLSFDPAHPSSPLAYTDTVTTYIEQNKQHDRNSEEKSKKRPF